MNVDKVIPVDKLVKGRFQVKSSEHHLNLDNQSNSFRIISNSSNGSRSSSMPITGARSMTRWVCAVGNRWAAPTSPAGSGLPGPPCRACPRSVETFSQKFFLSRNPMIVLIFRPGLPPRPQAGQPPGRRAARGEQRPTAAAGGWGRPPRRRSRTSTTR